MTPTPVQINEARGAFIQGWVTVVKPTQEIMGKQVYPLDGNPDLLHVCYQRINESLTTGAITHIVDNGGKTTLCGCNIENPSRWEFVIWSLKTDRQGVKQIGCRRCKNSRSIEAMP